MRFMMLKFTFYFHLLAGDIHNPKMLNVIYITQDINILKS